MSETEDNKPEEEEKKSIEAPKDVDAAFKEAVEQAEAATGEIEEALEEALTPQAPPPWIDLLLAVPTNPPKPDEYHSISLLRDRIVRFSLVCELVDLGAKGEPKYIVLSNVPNDDMPAQAALFKATMTNFQQLSDRAALAAKKQGKVLKPGTAQFEAAKRIMGNGKRGHGK